jgi:hypothetical protein
VAGKLLVTAVTSPPRCPDSGEIERMLARVMTILETSIDKVVIIDPDQRLTSGLLSSLAG